MEILGAFFMNYLLLIINDYWRDMKEIWKLCGNVFLSFRELNKATTTDDLIYVGNKKVYRRERTRYSHPHIYHLQNS